MTRQNIISAGKFVVIMVSCSKLYHIFYFYFFRKMIKIFDSHPPSLIVALHTLIVYRS